MLSYQHDYHAGNFADVLKHIVLVHVLRHLLKKEKPILYVDTHAGSGHYMLDSTLAQRLNESNNGIKRLCAFCEEKNQIIPPAIKDYLSLIKAFNGVSCSLENVKYPVPLVNYPGSPALACALLRKQDSMQLTELHPQAFAALCATVPRQLEDGVENPLISTWGLNAALKRKHIYLPRVLCQREDGFQKLKAVLPPLSGRACVLIDPSFEEKKDYTRVISAIVSAYKRCAHAVFLLWYPIVKRERVMLLEQTLRDSGIPDVMLYELSIYPYALEKGMTGSGMIVINPPWLLSETMEDVLPFLKAVLSDTSFCDHSVGSHQKSLWRVSSLKDH